MSSADKILGGLKEADLRDFVLKRRFCAILEQNLAFSRSPRTLRHTRVWYIVRIKIQYLARSGTKCGYTFLFGIRIRIWARIIHLVVFSGVLWHNICRMAVCNLIASATYRPTDHYPIS